MHICFVNLPIERYSPNTGGALSTIINETTQVLLDRRHHVTVISSTGGDPPYTNGTLARLPDRPSLVTRIGSLMNRTVRRAPVGWEWPHYASYLSAVSGAAASIAPEPDVFVTFNDLQLPATLRELHPRARIVTWLQNHYESRQPALDAVDLLLTCSTDVADWARRHYGPSSPPAVVVPSGVNTESFHPRHGFLVPPPVCRVLFVGRLDPNKGPDIAIDAVRTLRHLGIPMEVTVAGATWWYDDDGRDPYAQRVREMVASTGGTALGHVGRDAIAGVFRAHDVVCVPSRAPEPFGLVVLEAMASGCAVVSSDRGGLPEACGGAAVMADPDRPEEWVEALRRLATDANALADAKQAAVDRAASQPWLVTAQGLESAIAAIDQRAETRDR